MGANKDLEETSALSLCASMGKSRDFGKSKVAALARQAPPQAAALDANALRNYSQSLIRRQQKGSQPSPGTW